jgi:hypothetical protein
LIRFIRTNLYWAGSGPCKVRAWVGFWLVTYVTRWSKGYKWLRSKNCFECSCNRGNLLVRDDVTVRLWHVRQGSRRGHRLCRFGHTWKPERYNFFSKTSMCILCGIKRIFFWKKYHWFQGPLRIHIPIIFSSAFFVSMKINMPCLWMSLNRKSVGNPPPLKKIKTIKIAWSRNAHGSTPEKVF